MTETSGREAKNAIETIDLDLWYGTFQALEKVNFQVKNWHYHEPDRAVRLW